MLSWTDKQRIYIQTILGIEPPLDDTLEHLAYRRKYKAMYCEPTDLFLGFGKANIIKWADVDNNNDNNSINTRIAWAIENATNELDGKLADSPYQFPLAVGGPYPPVLIKMCASLAAVMLYDSRGISDENKETGLSKHKKAVDMFVRDIYARRMTLPGAILNPDAVDISTTPDFVPLGATIIGEEIGLPNWNKWQ